MPMTSFRSDRLPPTARIPGWRETLTDFALLSAVDDGPERFCGHVAGFRSPRGISFSIVESGPQQLSPIADRHDAVFWLSMVLDGQSSLLLGDVRIAVAPGDLLFGKRGAAGILDIQTPFRMAMANIPAPLLERASLVPLPMQLVHLRDGPGPVHVLGATLAAVTASIDRLDDASTLAMEAAIVQLLLSSLFDDTGLNPLGGIATARAAALRRICRSIERRLHDHALKLATIAAEERVSTRYVQSLFEESGQTFRDHVRTRRLEKARCALADPLNDNISITAICLHWGFSDSASFSRAFRDAYACSPSAYRRRMRGGDRLFAGRLRGLVLVEE